MRKTAIVCLILLLMLLAATVLTACEMAGQPQPTATPKPATPLPTKDDNVTKAPVPTKPADYPLPQITPYPKP